jgi:hypothetical protein
MADPANKIVPTRARDSLDKRGLMQNLLIPLHSDYRDGYHRAKTTAPSTIATSVVAISRVRRLKRHRNVGSQESAVREASSKTANQCGK